MNKLKSMLTSPKRIALFAICVVAILAVVAFAGIKVGASVMNSQGIGLEKATQVALQNAGYSESEATLIRGHFDREDGLNVYDIEFRAGGYDYDYVVSAKDGTIVSVDREMADNQLPAGSGSSDTQTGQQNSNQSASNNTQPSVSSQSSSSGQSQTSQSGTGSSGSTGSAASSSNANYIGTDKAKTIALQNAGVSASSATFTKTKLDRDDGIYVYDIEFVSGNYEYSYEIHATKGTILQRDAEVISSGGHSTSGNSSQISVDKAKTIALQNAGVNASSATFTKTKLDRDDGIYVYEIEFVSGDREYSYEINAASGTVLDWDIESIHD